jgi:uncharacterized protein DUF1153
VIGPEASPLTIADLPAPETMRWVIRRKAKVVAAVRSGLLSLEEACSRYTLTIEEILAWQYSIDRHGVAGLRTTRLQQYRRLSASKDLSSTEIVKCLQMVGLVDRDPGTLTSVSSALEGSGYERITYIYEHSAGSG